MSAAIEEGYRLETSAALWLVQSNLLAAAPALAYSVVLRDRLRMFRERQVGQSGRARSMARRSVVRTWRKE
jgi:hypothetical protein